VVVVHRPENAYLPFVVAWQGGEQPGSYDREWLGGDYCRTIEEAGAAFSERARRYDASPTYTGRAILSLISVDLPATE
jgi:hypothetical protein